VVAPDNRERTAAGARWRWVVGGIAGGAIAGVGVVLAWWGFRDGASLAQFAQAGDAAALLGGVAAPVALIAAVWSVIIQGRQLGEQKEELILQRQELAQSREALQAQVAEQRRLLEHQQDQQREERTHRLRQAYGEWFSALFGAIAEWRTVAMVRYGHALEHGLRMDVEMGELEARRLEIQAGARRHSLVLIEPEGGCLDEVERLSVFPGPRDGQKTISAETYKLWDEKLEVHQRAAERFAVRLRARFEKLGRE
jgi:hypothetical protein